MNWLNCDSIEELKQYYSSLKELRLEINTSLNGQEKITSNSWDGLLKKIKLFRSTLSELTNNLSVEQDEISFFKSKKHEEIFYILNFEKNFDKELGISRKHYVDKELAKLWRREMLKKYHNSITLDKNGKSQNNDFPSDVYIKIEANLILIYKRMVGEA